MPDSNARYSAASAEIQTRIQSRNNLAMQYVTYAAAIIGIATSKDDWKILAASVGYVALGIVFLNRSHILFIAHLVKFQQELIKHDVSHTQLPDWNSQDRVRATSAARRAADHSQIYFLIATVLLSSIVSLPQLNPITWSVIFWGLGVGAGALSVWVFYDTGIKRDEIMQNP